MMQASRMENLVEKVNNLKVEPIQKLPDHINDIIIAHGFDFTPPYLQRLLKGFDQFSQETIPSSNFKISYLPRLMAWMVLIHNVLNCTCSSNMSFGNDKTTIYTNNDAELRGLSSSCFYKAAEQFQQTIDRIFKILDDRKLLVAGQPLSIRDNVFFEPVIQEILNLFMPHSDEEKQAMQQINRPDNRDSDIFELSMHRIIGIPTIPVNMNKRLLIDGNMMLAVICMQLKSGFTGSPSAILEETTKCKTDICQIRKSMATICAKHILFWRKEGYHYFVAPAKKNSSMVDQAFVKWKPCNTVSNAEEALTFPTFIYANNALETRSGIMIEVDLSINQVFIGYKDDYKAYRISMIDYDRREFAKNFLSTFFPELSTTKQRKQEWFNKFIAMPRTYKEWQSIGLEEFFNQEEDKNIRNFFTELGFNSDNLPDTLKILEDYTSYMERETKSQRRAAKKAAAAEEEERKQNQKKRNKERLSFLQEQPMNNYNDLIKFINVCNKSRSEQSGTTTTSSRGSHRTLHTPSGIVSAVVPHGRQKGNKVSKETQKNLQRRIGSNNNDGD
ncbi:hypothetical protein [Candidatus Cardinium hertigii]|nr:hypothetical protein [Candidatus Cardinium hertigii]